MMHYIPTVDTRSLLHFQSRHRKNPSFVFLQSVAAESYANACAQILGALEESHKNILNEP